ncbi:hypothetical protein QE152_g33363 [Popillia japonica]|uniref:Uncharacterized protein n=1 Tax=Popillia japonica TaxID=7064 RepID=A0AAW1IX22_POPJA
MESWKDHFEENLKEGIEEQPPEEITMVDEESVITEPTVEEIKTIIQQVKNYKNLRENTIAADHMKSRRIDLQKRITVVIKEIGETEAISSNWSNLQKKVLAMLLKHRVEEYREIEVGDYQGGFRKTGDVTKAQGGRI